MAHFPDDQTEAQNVSWFCQCQSTSVDTAQISVQINNLS